MPDDVQVSEETQGGGLFDSYLQSVPEDGREAVMSYLKDAEKNVNQRLEKAASWEPYENVDLLRQYQPDQLGELLQWHQQVQDEGTYKQFVENAARELELLPQEEKEAEEEALEAEGFTRQEAERLADERVAAQVGPLAERVEQWETEKAVDAEDSNIKSEFERLEGEHSLNLTKDQKAIVLDLGMNHEGENWVQYGFDRFRSMSTEAVNAFVDQKAAQPASNTLAGGGTERFKPSMTFKDAEARTKERLRQAWQ